MITLLHVQGMLSCSEQRNCLGENLYFRAATGGRSTKFDGMA